LDGLRKQVGQEKILAIVEPRSNTMRLGVHTQSLAESLAQADEAIIYQPENLGWDLSQLLQYAQNIRICSDLEVIIDTIKAEKDGVCHVLLMSNGSFGGIYQRLKEDFNRPQ
jgi:UDP-N-acetylmuramate: L-alanyl-gamma-D-glutamyl-meso-diaminopimelate ligase